MFLCTYDLRIAGNLAEGVGKFKNKQPLQEGSRVETRQVLPFRVETRLVLPFSVRPTHSQRMAAIDQRGVGVELTLKSALQTLSRCGCGVETKERASHTLKPPASWACVSFILLGMSFIGVRLIGCGSHWCCLAIVLAVAGGCYKLRVC